MHAQRMKQSRSLMRMYSSGRHHLEDEAEGEPAVEVEALGLEEGTAALLAVDEDNDVLHLKLHLLQTRHGAARSVL